MALFYTLKKCKKVVAMCAIILQGNPGFSFRKSIDLLQYDYCKKVMVVISNSKKCYPYCIHTVVIKVLYIH